MKDTLNQFIIVQKSGECNMFDYQCVTWHANELGLYALACLDKKEYRKILTNFDALIKKHGVVY